MLWLLRWCAASLRESRTNRRITGFVFVVATPSQLDPVVVAVSSFFFFIQGFARSWKLAFTVISPVSPLLREIVGCCARDP